jgi:hypothetical protein
MARSVTVLKSVYVEQYKTKFRTSTENAVGSGATLVIGTPNPADHWFIERVAVFSDTASTSVKAFLLVGDDPSRGIDWSAMMDVSLCGAADAADERQPVYAGPGEEVKVRWEGINAGDNVYCNVQVSVCALVSAEVPSPITFDRFAINVDRSW